MREVRCREVPHFSFLCSPESAKNELVELRNDVLNIRTVIKRNFAEWTLIAIFANMKEIKKLYLIINPISGTKSKKGLDSKLVDRLEKAGFDVTVGFTGGPGDATEMARQAAAEGYDGVLACGGDGTINETAKGLLGTGVPLGILPAGSGNGLARHLGIPVDARAACDIVAKRCVRDCDYGDVNGNPFFCTFGIGFDAAVSDRFAASPKRGRMTYVKSALHEFRHYNPLDYRILADDEEIDMKAFLITVANANQYGNNAYIAPDASVTDGKLNLVIVPRITKMGTLPLGIRLMSGTLDKSKKLVHRRVNKVVIERAESGPAHLDGEPFGNAGKHIEINCHPGQLAIFVNPDKRKFKPYLTPMRGMGQGIGLSVKNLFKK